MLRHHDHPIRRCHRQHRHKDHQQQTVGVIGIATLVTASPSSSLSSLQTTTIDPTQSGSSFTYSPSCFAFAARAAMASASTSRGASQPAKEHQDALRGAIERADASASSSSMLPGRAQSKRTAAQPSPSTRQDRITDVAAGISGSQGNGDANSIAVQPGAAATAPRPPPPLVARDRASTPPEGSLWELIRVICRIRYVSGAVWCLLAQWRIIRRTRAGQDPEIFCHHISAFLIAPRECCYLDEDIAKLIRVARASSPGWLASIADPTHVPRRSSTSSRVRMQARRVSRGSQEEGMLKKAARKQRLARQARQLLGRMWQRRCFSG